MIHPRDCWHKWQEVYRTDKDGMPIPDTVQIICRNCGDRL